MAHLTVDPVVDKIAHDRVTDPMGLADLTAVDVAQVKVVAGGGRGRGDGRTNEAWVDQKIGFYYAVVGQMVSQGFTPEEIGKVGGGNFCRVFDAATVGHP